MMFKARIAVPLLGALLLPLAARAQDFQGSVTYLVSARNIQNVEMVHHVKGNDIRVDMNVDGHAISMITDMQMSKQVVLVHQTRQWIDAKVMQERLAIMMQQMEAKRGETAKVINELNMRATGEKETIAGIECDHYSMRADASDIDICAAKGMGWYLANMAEGALASMRGLRGASVPGLSSAAREQWKQLFADGFFPLKITVTGSSSMTLLATDVSQKTLEPSVFRAPSDYNEMRIGG